MLNSSSRSGSEWTRMDSEFPGVIDLDVGGTSYRALLTTLTKDEDSKLSAMFTHKLPVYKDKHDRYFIEADGLTFKAILHYLQYDELPFQTTNGHASFGQWGYDAQFIKTLYKDALNLGLAKLAKHLEQFEPNLVKTKMDEYRDSIRGYDNCVSEILRRISPESLFHQTEFTVRIIQDLQTIPDEKCCEHECRATTGAFSQSYYPSIDAKLKIRFELNPTILSALVIDFQKRGYKVQGRVTVCDFDCTKETKQSKYVVFTQRKKCCGAELFLLTFRFDSETDAVAQYGLFGVKNKFGPKQTTGFLFGAQNNAGFGIQNNSGFSFGSPQQKPAESAAFGFAQSQANNQSFGFGTSQSNNQAQGFGFGSNIQNTFGNQGHGGLFGSTQNTNTGQNGTTLGTNQGVFGQGSANGLGCFQQTPPQQKTGSVFGDQSSTGTGFRFGGQSFQQQQQQQQQQPQKQTSLFGKVAQPVKPFSVSPSQATTQHQETFSFSSPTGTSAKSQQNCKPMGPFGATVVSAQNQQNSKPTGFGFSGLAGSSGNSPVFGGSSRPIVKAARNVTTSQTIASPKFSFGSSPNQSTAFAGTGTASGLFGGSTKKQQPTFGGQATFENKFENLSLHSKKSDKNGDQSVSSGETGRSLFGKPNFTLAGNNLSGKPNETGFGTSTDNGSGLFGKSSSLSGSSLGNAAAFKTGSNLSGKPNETGFGISTDNGSGLFGKSSPLSGSSLGNAAAFKTGSNLSGKPNETGFGISTDNGSGLFGKSSPLSGSSLGNAAAFKTGSNSSGKPNETGFGISTDNGSGLFGKSSPLSGSSLGNAAAFKTGSNLSGKPNETGFGISTDNGSGLFGKSSSLSGSSLGNAAAFKTNIFGQTSDLEDKENAGENDSIEPNKSDDIESNSADDNDAPNDLKDANSEI